MKNNTKRRIISISLMLMTIATAIVAISAQNIQVGNVEELYSEVNDPANTGATLTLAPGSYLLSATDPSGAARPNGGRLELRKNMSLTGVEGDRSAVVIDATNLLPSPRAAIRIGRGSNAIEWLTVRNAIYAQANVDTGHTNEPGTAYVRIAHIASTGAQRGLDIRNQGPGSAGETIEADIVDSHFFNNNIGSPNMGIRIINTNTSAATINARLVGNRSWGQGTGMVVTEESAESSATNVCSSGNRFFDNGNGIDILGAFASDAVETNGNTINFEAHGDQYFNSVPIDPDFVGGIIISGGFSTFPLPNLANNNTVNVTFWGCRMANNTAYDLYAVGARSIRQAAGLTPGMNNHVTIEIHGEGSDQSHWRPIEFFADSIPDDPSLNNTVTVIR